MDKMTSGVKGASEGSVDPMEKGFELSFDNFEVEGLFKKEPPVVKPVPAPAVKGPDTLITIKTDDKAPCDKAKPAAAAAPAAAVAPKVEAAPVKK